jgi:hypothetical protein
MFVFFSIILVKLKMLLLWTTYEIWSKTEINHSGDTRFTWKTPPTWRGKITGTSQQQYHYLKSLGYTHMAAYKRIKSPRNPSKGIYVPYLIGRLQTPLCSGLAFGFYGPPLRSVRSPAYILHWIWNNSNKLHLETNSSCITNQPIILNNKDRKPLVPTIVYWTIQLNQLSLSITQT